MATIEVDRIYSARVKGRRQFVIIRAVCNDGKLQVARGKRFGTWGYIDPSDIVHGPYHLCAGGCSTVVFEENELCPVCTEEYRRLHVIDAPADCMCASCCERRQDELRARQRRRGPLAPVRQENEHGQES